MNNLHGYLAEQVALNVLTAVTADGRDDALPVR